MKTFQTSRPLQRRTAKHTKKRNWAKIYREQGEVQKEVLPKVVAASKLFKRKNFKKILDLACGTGRHSIYLAMEGFMVYATDASKEGVNVTKGKAKRYGLTNINFRVHDMKKIPFRAHCFDGVVCVWSMGHGKLANQQRVVDEIHRVLRPGGVVITDFMSTKDETYGKGREIETNTFIGGMKGEEDVPHHYATKAELQKLFSKFANVKIRQAQFIFSDSAGKKHSIQAFNVEATK